VHEIVVEEGGHVGLVALVEVVVGFMGRGNLIALEVVDFLAGAKGELGRVN
jgi:hypothetical protein